jgi:DsbC/DsbD-like thiol-disulfide interchange protein
VLVGSRARAAALLLVSVAFATWGTSAGAGGHVTATLLSEQASVKPGGPFTVGLEMTMRPGWHTYWRNPGDSGLPLKITWKLPEGFTAGPIEWPAPERIPSEALMSYGYEGVVLLPVEITPPARLAADSVTVGGTFEWLECAEVCVPGSASLHLSLPVLEERPGPGSAAPLFAAARARIPAPPTGWALDAETGPRAVSLRFRPPSGPSVRSAYLFVDQPLVVDYAAPQGFERTESGYRVTATPAPNAQEPPSRLTGVLVLEGRPGPRSRTAVQVDVPVSRGDPAPAPPPAPSASLPAGLAAIASVVAIAGLGLAIFLLRRRSAHPRKEPS